MCIWQEGSSFRPREIRPGSYEFDFDLNHYELMNIDFVSVRRHDLERLEEEMLSSLQSVRIFVRSSRLTIGVKISGLFENIRSTVAKLGMMLLPVQVISSYARQ